MAEADAAYTAAEEEARDALCHAEVVCDFNLYFDLTLIYTRNYTCTLRRVLVRPLR